MRTSYVDFSYIFVNCYRFSDEAPRCPVTVDQSPTAGDENGVPRVLTRIAVESQSRSVLGTFRISAHRHALETRVTVTLFTYLLT